jgi:NAD(P)-dependent dehydrogenase (short-subunit alcohol dehydrogenase family)
MRFTDKSIIVTGAGSGIGRAAALLFASEGGSVVVADKTEGAYETAHLITQAGGTAKAIRIDAGLEEDVIRTIALACDSFGGLDVMFANAGISGGMANLFDTDVALITEVLRVNLIGPFLAIKHAAPRIAEPPASPAFAPAPARPPIPRRKPASSTSPPSPRNN